MTIKKYQIWLANLDPKFGSEPGKTRPVLILQTDLLNEVHPSVIISPMTTNIKPDSRILRVHVKKEIANVKEDCDIMIDQLRAIDKTRLIKKIGVIPQGLQEKVKENLKIILELEN